MQHHHHERLDQQHSFNPGAHGRHADHAAQLDDATHTGHAGHDKHTGHSPEIFKRRFFIYLVLTLPVLYFSSHFQEWFGYQAIQFPGFEWVAPILAVCCLKIKLRSFVN
jgi:P-type Cu2+ transporter